MYLSFYIKTNYRHVFIFAENFGNIFETGTFSDEFVFKLDPWLSDLNLNVNERIYATTQSGMGHGVWILHL